MTKRLEFRRKLMPADTKCWWYPEQSIGVEVRLLAVNYWTHGDFAEIVIDGRHKLVPMSQISEAIRVL